MKLVESIMTNNPCYKAGRKITVKGLMLHSVGCPQPSATSFIKSWNQSSYDRACVHGFIDANDGTAYQTLPWDHRGWHCGGDANNTHIGVEMCEPGNIKYTSGTSFSCSDKAAAKACAKRTYDSAVELFAMLCEKFSLNPTADGVIISHREGSVRGVASNHGDPEHLWKGLGLSYTMDGFRNDVKSAMSRGNSQPTTSTSGGGASTTGDKAAWDFLFGKIGNAYGVAGVMGNLYAESGIRSDNLQNSSEKKLGFSDTEYTAKVDKGTYTAFTTDGAGYGLAQWTYKTRKQALLDFAKEKGVSIGDFSMQLEFLWKELSGEYKGLLSSLKAAKSVTEASTAFLTQFEKPADQGASVQKKRASYGQGYYDKYAGEKDNLYRVRKTWTDEKGQKGAYKTLSNAKKCADANPGYFVFDADGKVVYPVAANVSSIDGTPFKVKVAAMDLRIRTGPGTDYGTTGKFTGIGTFTITEVKSGKGSTAGWGKLKSGAGWISLDYAKRI